MLSFKVKNDQETKGKIKKIVLTKIYRGLGFYWLMSLNRC